MTEAIRQQLIDAGIKPAAARKAPGEGKRKPSGADEPTAAEIAARKEVVKVGYAKGHYAGFGFVQPYRRYTLLDEEQAKALDVEFFRITGATPPQS